MSERNDTTNKADDLQPPAAKPRDEEIVSDELAEELEDVSGGGGSTGNNFNCGCGSAE
jgi:hypothetical protein